MTLVQLIHLDKTRAYGMVLVPLSQVPQILRQGNHIYSFLCKEGVRLVFEEVGFLDVWTESEIEQAKASGVVT